MPEKIKMPEFYMIFARKINKMPEFYTIFARKKIVFARIWGATAPLPPVSYAYGLTDNCRREAYRLHADVVMSLEDIFGYLLENWMDLDKTWQRDGKWGKSDPVKFLPRWLPRQADLFRDEYDVWSLPLYRFPRNLAEIRESMCR